MKHNIKIYREIIQRTDAWLEIKRGKASGSKVKPVLSSRTPAPLMTYAYELIAQDEYKHKMHYEEGFLSKGVQWGRDMEPIAIKRFEDEYMKITEEVGWIESEDPKLKHRHGCSPDGIIDIWSWIEVKCLNTANHLRAVVNNKVPTEHMPQIINYFVTNVDLHIVYFILFDPRVKTESKQLHVIEIKREDIVDKVDEGYEKIVKFLDMKDALYNEFKGPKVCKKCGESKDRSEFMKHWHAKDGIMGICKECKVKSHKKPRKRKKRNWKKEAINRELKKNGNK